MQNKRSVGANYEQIAGEYLKTKGYEIIQYNFYSKSGEIDIVANHGGYLVFVEVKYRESNRNGHPLEAVSSTKQKAISKCAAYYLKKNKISDIPVRFDVVGILGKQITLIQNAFDYVG